MHTFKTENTRLAAAFAALRDYLDAAPDFQLPRTFGVEIETPNAETVRNSLTREQASLLSWKGDGSVKFEGEREDCECDCSECIYHDCNCDLCDNRNENPDHCYEDECFGSDQPEDYQEITTQNGGVKSTKAEPLQVLTESSLGSAEINETCGLHVHVYSGDLAPAQVAQVLRTYRALADRLEPIAGRRDSYYAQDLHEGSIIDALDGRGSLKYRAVNTAPHFTTSTDKAPTLEFRQHEGTNEIAEVRAWSVLMVALVEYSKRNTSNYWLIRPQSGDELLNELFRGAGIHLPSLPESEGPTD